MLINPDLFATTKFELNKYISLVFQLLKLNDV